MKNDRDIENAKIGEVELELSSTFTKIDQHEKSVTIKNSENDPNTGRKTDLMTEFDKRENEKEKEMKLKNLWWQNNYDDTVRTKNENDLYLHVNIELERSLDPNSTGLIQKVWTTAYKI